MAKIGSSGFVRVVNGQATHVTVPGTHYESSRVRWRGVKREYNISDISYGTWQALAPLPGGLPVVTSIQTQATYQAIGVVKAEYWIHAPWGSILQETAVFSGSHTFNGAAADPAFYGGQLCMHSLNILQGSGQVASASIMVIVVGLIREQTQNPKIRVGVEEVAGPASLDDGVVSDWYQFDHLVLGDNTLNHSIEGSDLADVDVEYTYQPLPTVNRESPLNTAVLDDRTPAFEMTIPSDAESDATAYWPRLTLSRYPGMLEPVVHDSSTDQDGWEYLDDETWTPFPAEGVPPGTRVRFIPEANLSIGNWFWMVAAKDDWGWGSDTGTWLLKLVLSVDALEGYALAIDSVDYPCLDLEIVETCNGQIGTITFTINNLPDAEGIRNNSRIDYRDIVDVSIYDSTGAERQYRGRVWEKSPGETTLQVIAGMGDKVFADRQAHQDYLGQDLGAALVSGVDTYCSPVLSTGIPNPMGITVNLPVNGKPILEMFREVVSVWGHRFWVQTEATDWVAYIVNPLELLPQGVYIRYGDGNAG